MKPLFISGTKKDSSLFFGRDKSSSHYYFDTIHYSPATVHLDFAQILLSLVHLAQMDGLEDTAEASMNELLDQLRSKDRVEIRHSSRTTVMLRVCEELRAPTTTVKSLVFRSGTSIIDSERLDDALRFNDTLEALTFVCLKNTLEIRAAIRCCRHNPRLKSLSLMNYTPSMSRREGEGRETIAKTICEAVFGTPVDEECRGTTYKGGVPNISRFELDNYPLGSQGIQIMEDAIACSKNLIVLRLTSCDLRSDSTRSIAEIIKRNRHLSVLDLSHNRLLLGDGIKKEMTLNDLVKRGLRFNTSLLELELQAKNLGKIERQLSINRFRVACIQTRRDPFIIPSNVWAEILSKVAPKPSALFETLRYGAMALFR